MQSSAKDLIADIADVHHIKLEQYKSVECHLFVYAYVFNDSDERLQNIVNSQSNISKISIEEIYNAFSKIHRCFINIKKFGTVPNEIEILVANCKSTLVAAISQLEMALEVYDSSKKNMNKKIESPEEIRLRAEAKRILTSSLLTCSDHLAQIIPEMEEWSTVDKKLICQSGSIAPSPPTSFEKEKRKRGTRSA